MDYNSWLDYIGAPARGVNTARARLGAPRGNPYAGANTDRLVADTLTAIGVYSANAEIRMGLRALRQRSRALFRNNEYAKSFVRLVINNVAGPYGFKFQSKVRKARGAPDDGANAQIEAAFKAFSKRGKFTACGTMSRRTFERAMTGDLMRDGELLIELVDGFKGNEFRFAVRRLDPDLLDDELNAGFGSAAPGGAYAGSDREIRMGVERDRWGRVTGYWLRNVHQGEDYSAGMGLPTHRRLDARQVLHIFLADTERPGAVRGTPLMSPAIRRMQIVNGYEESALVAARAGASKMAFYKPPAEEPSADGTTVADTKDGADLLSEFEPGTMGVLPPGWDVETFDPSYPNEKFDTFVKRMLRAFAAGVGVSYNSIASDLEGVNLSSLRYGVQDDRDSYEGLQAFLIEEIDEVIFERWLKSSLDFGAIGRLPMGPEAEARFNAPQFTARGWKYMNPVDDIEADERAIALGIKSRTTACAERGEDFEEVLQEQAAEQQLAAQYGVTLKSNSTPPRPPRADKPEDSAPADKSISENGESEDE